MKKYTTAQLLALSKKHACVLVNEGERMLICTDLSSDLTEEQFGEMFGDFTEEENDMLADCAFHNMLMIDRDEIETFLEDGPDPVYGETIFVTTWAQHVLDDKAWCAEILEERCE